jgi:hypothetical protein
MAGTAGVADIAASVARYGVTTAKRYGVLTA